ncbi:hypothetical protein JQM83_08790 [Parabacteroides distasonis]|nr:hypothetical protein [Parabacteroides distasonis]
MKKPFVFGITLEEDHFVSRKKVINRLSTYFHYGVLFLAMVLTVYVSLPFCHWHKGALISFGRLIM